MPSRLAILFLLLAVGCAPDTQPRRAVFEVVRDVPAVTDRASTGGVSWIDFDADGDLDLYVTNGYDVSADEAVPQANRLYRNDGHGVLTPVTNSPLVDVAGFSSGSTWGDYDNDGDLDVFVTNQRDQDNFLFRNRGDGTFEQILDQPPAMDGGSSFSAGWVDVDSDGWLDLHVANGGLSQLESNFLYRNLGDGAFERVTDTVVTADTTGSGGAVWADMDLDGDPDLFVANRSGQSDLFRNEGDWTFERVTDSPMLDNVFPAIAAAWADYDNDGDPDLAIGTMYGGPTRVFENDGSGTFTEVLDAGDAVIDGGNAYGLNWGDYDNDGDLDLVVANWGAATVLYENLSAGRFERVPSRDFIDHVGFASSLAWADVDGDGDLDFYQGNWPNHPGAGEPNLLMRNGLAIGNWLAVRLEGTRSNRAAIGARVTVEATIDGSSTRQTRTVQGHTSWRSQNPLLLHFGLGDAAVVDRITVHWPSGIEHVTTGVPANQSLLLVEPAG